MIEARGMELDEFKIGYRGSRPVRHGDAVSGRHIGIAGVCVDLSRAAGGQHDGPGAEGVNAVGFFVKDICPVAVIFMGGYDRASFEPDRLGNQVDGDMMFKQADVLLVLHPVNQRFFNRQPCHVGGVNNAVCGMAALAAQVQMQPDGFARIVCFLIERDAEIDEFTDSIRRVFHDHFDNGFVAYAVTGLQRIFDMQVKRVHAG